MSYCTGFVLGNVICGVTYLMFKNKMNDDDNDEQPPNQTTEQRGAVVTTSSIISQSTNCNTIDNNNTPEITIRYENILTATANYANLLNNNNNELQEESIEYELTDYMLQNDIETIHSMNSLRSSRSSIDAPSYSQVDDHNNDDDLQLSYSQEESVYNNFDDLFEIRDSWMTDNSGSISLDTDTIIVGLDDGGGDEARDDGENVGSVSKEGEIDVDMGIKDKPDTMPTEGDEGEDGAEILKKLVIKCLVRNNCKGGGLAKGKSRPRSVRSSGGEKEKIFPSLPKDPSLEENSNKDPSSRQDPPSAEETSQKYHQQIYEQQQHQQGGSRVGGGGGEMSVSSINSNRYPPRPDIVRYNNNMVMMQSRRQLQYKQKPPRPDLIQCNASSAPLSRCHSSYSCSTHAQQLTTPRSLVVTNPSLPGSITELSPVAAEGGVGSGKYVIGQGELRRRHYKEMLRQQRQKESMQVASPLGSDSTMIPTKVPTLV